MKTVFLVIGLITMFLFHSESSAYSTKVHERITARVIDLNTEKFNEYLKNIGLTNGVEEYVNNKYIRTWIEEGSVAEDTTAGGLCTHFYNPLTNLSGVCGESTPSAYDWANTENNDWSWQKARSYFYDGLTQTKKANREKSLANSFKALGHVVHLLQDVAVPAHARGDLHAIQPLGFILFVGDDSYEKYTNKNISGLNYSQSLFGGSKISVSPGAPRQFWDIDTYTTTTFPGWDTGLAEYTSYNFLSDGTIFKSMPYPKFSSQTYEVREEDYSTTKKRIYLKKIGDGEIVEHFATYGVFSKYLSDLELKMSSLKLDDKCHNDYQDKLIPRAVGYSAGLLNYFFRGDVEAVDPWAIQGPSGEITGAKFKVKNKTPNESMVGGTFVIAYQYKPAGSDDFIYGTSSNASLSEKLDTGNESQSELTFNFSSPIPRNAKEKRYVLVYNGKLGSEENAVAASQIKDMRMWPRSGVIGRMTYVMNEAVVWIMSEKNSKVYKIAVSEKERMLNVAFDEGNLDTIRIFSQMITDEDMIYNLYTFVYSQNTDQYEKKDTQEILRTSRITPEIRKEFSYTVQNTLQGGATTTESYSGFVDETTNNDIYMLDFFTPLKQEAKFMIHNGKTVTLKPPFLARYEYNFERYNQSENCLHKLYKADEYIGGDLANPLCRKETKVLGDCSENTSEISEGYCKQISSTIGYRSWPECRPESSAGILLFKTLKYNDFLKTYENPKLTNTDQLWTTEDDGMYSYKAPHLTNPGAQNVTAEISGKILSNTQLILKYYFKDPPSYEYVHEIKPDGIMLAEIPFAYIMLRQSNGYSMCVYEYYRDDGQTPCYASHTSVLPSNPLVLNSEGNGFKISYEWSGYLRLKFKPGVKYNKTIQDFEKISKFDLNVSQVLDIMVEYVDE